MTIAASILAQIHDHLEAGYPHEVCGVMLGRNGCVQEIVPASNQDADCPRSRYAIAPRDYARIEREADQRGLQVLGIYHSHPDGAARPSATDLEAAWPELSYLIVAVARGRAVDSSCWRLHPTQRLFAPEPIQSP